MQTKQLTKNLIYIFGILLFLWIIEYLNSGKYQGAVILSFDVICEVLTAVITFKSKLVRNIIGTLGSFYFGMMFLSLGIADLSWGSIFYIFHLNSRIPLVSGLIAGSYSSAFLFCTLGFLQVLKKKDILVSRYGLLGLAIITPIFANFLLIPFIKSIGGQYLTVFNIGETVALITSFSMMFVGLVVLFTTLDLFWSFFSAGVVSIVFADWAMRVEKIVGYSTDFGFYEFFWTFGILVWITPFVFYRKSITQIHTKNLNSLIVNYKVWTGVLVFISILFFCFTEGSQIGKIKIISVGCGCD